MTSDIVKMCICGHLEEAHHHFNMKSHCVFCECGAYHRDKDYG